MSFRYQNGGAIPRVGQWEVKSYLLLQASRAATNCDDSRVISAKENISLETSHLQSNSLSFTLYCSTCVCLCVHVCECV